MNPSSLSFSITHLPQPTNTPLASFTPHGSNVLVGVGDSGLDVSNTFFYDASYSVNYGTGKLDSNHRKVALYYPYLGKTDVSTGGHGTHVCGIIAGKANKNSASIYNVSSRIADDAGSRVRQSTDDLRFGERQGGVLHPQQPLSRLLRYLVVCRRSLRRSYERGVRLVSNSWGAVDAYDYDKSCSQVDKFVWENNDMTIVIAAGNDGEKGFGRVSIHYQIQDGGTSRARQERNLRRLEQRKPRRAPLGGSHLLLLFARRQRKQAVVMPFLVHSQRDAPRCQCWRRDLGQVAECLRLRSELRRPCRCGDDGRNISVCWLWRDLDDTSMATPSVSASIAILTQYLNEGYYHNRIDGWGE